jgi:ribosome-binding ATPase YchF (GTP1/OBG family)
VALEPEQWALLANVALLTAKPLLLVANVTEGDLPEGGPLAARVRAQAQAHGAEAIILCAQIESELTAWPVADAVAYMADLGLQEPGLNRFISAGYRLLDYITFFTTTGGKEVRAWTLRRGQTALEAAGAIHTDMARGFIRAEVVSYAQLDAAGSIARSRDVGHLRLEGREYVVQDGDVIHIRFAT